MLVSVARIAVLVLALLAGPRLAAAGDLSRDGVDIQAGPKQPDQPMHHHQGS